MALSLQYNKSFPSPQLGKINHVGEQKMNNAMLKLYVKMQNLMVREEGQDLVEYALIISLIAVVLVASLTTLEGKIAGVFSTIGTSL
jgi:pilus assembly protein Flp/PilA